MAAGEPNPLINLWRSLLLLAIEFKKLLPMVIQQMIFIGGKNLALSMLRNEKPAYYFLPSKSKFCLHYLAFPFCMIFFGSPL